MNELAIVFRGNFVFMSIYNSQLYWNDYFVRSTCCNLQSDRA